MEEAFTNVGPPFITNRQSPETPQPGQCSLDHPAIAAQLLAALDALAGNADLDGALRQRLSTARDVIGLVRMQLRRSLPWTATRAFDRLDSIQQRLKVDAVMAVRRSQQNGQRDALAFDDQVMFAAGFALVRGIAAKGKLARLQSMRSASPIWSSTARSGTRGRPPVGLGGTGGGSASITSQSSSQTSGFAIMPHPGSAQFRF